MRFAFLYVFPIVIILATAFFILTHLLPPPSTNYGPVQPPPIATPRPPRVASSTPVVVLPPLLPTAISYDVASVTAELPSTFAYAHGTAVADDRFFVGMEDRAGNTYPRDELVAFLQPTDLSKYRLIGLPKLGSVDTMTYDPTGDMLYFVLSGNNDLEIMALNPKTLGLSVVISTTTLDIGRRPAIATDGTYIYGITNTTPSVVFKVKTDGTDFTVSPYGHIPNGHSAAIAVENGETMLYFGGGMQDVFEKVRGSDLSVVGKLSVKPCSMTDDMPYIEGSDGVGYVFIGCEVSPFGYRIRASDLHVDRFVLPGQSLGIFSYKGLIYNVARDGNLDVFNGTNMSALTRYRVVDALTTLDTKGQNLELNELFYSPSADALFFTAWWGIPGIYRLGVPVRP